MNRTYVLYIKGEDTVYIPEDAIPQNAVFIRQTLMLEGTGFMISHCINLFEITYFRQKTA